LEDELWGRYAEFAVAVMVYFATAKFAVGAVVQIGIAVAICAIFAHKRPSLRVCMWTSPIVF